MKQATEDRIRECFERHKNVWLSISELSFRSKTHYYAIITYVANHRKTIRGIHGGRFFLYQLKPIRIRTRA